MTITVEQLREKEACETHVIIFAREWPNGAELTLANCFRAAELGLDLDWFAKEFLLPPAWKEYKKVFAWEEYDKATVPAWEEYKKAIALAWEEYDKAEAPALEKYDKTIAPAREEYKKATALAREEYNKAAAPALYHALIKQTGARAMTISAKKLREALRAAEPQPRELTDEEILDEFDWNPRVSLEKRALALSRWAIKQSRPAVCGPMADDVYQAAIDYHAGTKAGLVDIVPFRDFYDSRVRSIEEVEKPLKEEIAELKKVAAYNVEAHWRQAEAHWQQVDDLQSQLDAAKEQIAKLENTIGRATNEVIAKWIRECTTDWNDVDVAGTITELGIQVADLESQLAAAKAEKPFDWKDMPYMTKEKMREVVAAAEENETTRRNIQLGAEGMDCSFHRGVQNTIRALAGHVADQTAELLRKDNKIKSCGQEIHRLQSLLCKHNRQQRESRKESKPKPEWPKWFKWCRDMPNSPSLAQYVCLDSPSSYQTFRLDGSPGGGDKNYTWSLRNMVGNWHPIPGEPDVVREWREENEKPGEEISVVPRRKNYQGELVAIEKKKRQDRIEKLLVTGETNRTRIAARLGFSVAMVAKDVKEIYDRWHESEVEGRKSPKR